MSPDMSATNAIARAQGAAYEDALDVMRMATANASVLIDDFIVTVACERAEGLYTPTPAGLVWEIPTAPENQHVGIFVQDAHDRRFIPGLTVSCTVRLGDESYIEERDLPLVWHPFAFHYGTNWALPADGEYWFDVVLDASGFNRHDEVRGQRYERIARVEIGPLALKRGKRSHGPE